MRVVAAGADGCNAGWILARRYEDETDTAFAVALEPTFTDLLDWHGEQGRPPLAVDVPIGLESNGGSRSCDKQARAELMRRASSVFTPPGRFLLELHDRSYQEIRTEVKRRQKRGEAVHGISALTAALLPKIQEVDAALRADPSLHASVFEVHPELCFQRATGTALPSKRSQAGQIERLAFVERHFGKIRPLLANPPWKTSGADLTDVLAAFAALNTALSWPDGVDRLGDGTTDDNGSPIRMVVWGGGRLHEH